MNINHKKIKNILEYILIFIMFFIGIRKGGYYKEDSLIGIYIIQLISILYYIFSQGRIKLNKFIGTSFLMLIISYFIPLFIQNTATISGAINIASRIYSMYLVYIIISNSENKEKYIKALCVFTIICGIFALDEMSYKIFEMPIKFLGGGYIQEESTRIGSIFQYSNLLAILCVISSLYVINKLFENKEIKKKNKIINYVSIVFFTIIMLITQSKMALLLYIVSTICICIINKKYKNIIDILFCIVYSLVVASLTEIHGIFIILIALIITAFYIYFKINLVSKNSKFKFYFGCILFILLGILYINSTNNYASIFDRIIEYFNNFDSTKLRFTYYKDALKLIFSSPLNAIFGMGGNAFRTMYETVQDMQYISLETHSFFIQVFLEGGLIGITSILILICYLIKKAQNKNYLIMFVTLIIFATFDVFLTYTFMLYVFAIIMAMIKIDEEECKKAYKIINILIFILVFILLSMQVVAFFIFPFEVDNLNNSLEKQEKVINKCELALKYDPYDLEYIRDYTTACNTYVSILEIKEDIYGIDNTNKKYEIINKIYNNILNEIKYEKNNKYTIEDYVYYVYKYLDELVIINYKDNIKNGYELYLEDMIKEINKLKEFHSKNEYAIEVYKKSLNDVYIKYVYVNNIINSSKIYNILDTVEENEYINL